MHRFEDLPVQTTVRPDRMDAGRHEALHPRHDGLYSPFRNRIAARRVPRPVGSTPAPARNAIMVSTALFTLPVANTLAILGLPGGAEWIVLLVLGLLLFGRRLPEVGRSIGQSITQFKKGLKEVENDVKESDAQRRLPADQIPQGGEQSRERSQTH
ncbi:MAG: hypothetical protein RIS86_1110 [Planctomycetota bacterium]|jgi:sec-independent protein translocase protein TatA